MGHLDRWEEAQQDDRIEVQADLAKCVGHTERSHIESHADTRNEAELDLCAEDVEALEHLGEGRWHAEGRARVLV